MLNLATVGLQLLKCYWYFTRPLTLGVLGIVQDPKGQVLLVRHTYRPGWHLPGGGVQRGESLPEALCRELREEVQVACAANALELSGIFYHRCFYKHDHYAVFKIRQWQFLRPLAAWQANLEIAEIGFFPLNALPQELGRETAERLAEFGKADRS